MKTITTVSLICLLLTPIAQARDTFISIATGGTGGIYFPLGGALSKVWSDQIPNVKSTAEVTGGSIENVRLVVTDEAQAALGLANVAYEAYHGEGRFQRPGKQDILAIGALYPNALQIATVADTGINTPTNLAGKRVSVGAPGSGTEAMTRDVLGALSIKYDKFRSTLRLSFAETANALKDGTLDAGSLSVGLGTSALLDLASARDMRLVCFTEAQQQSVVAKFPYYAAFTIPGETYPGVKDACPTIQAANLLFVKADADAEMVYQMTKTLYENLEKLKQGRVAVAAMSPEFAMQATVIPLHPGAVRYFKEIGQEIPAKLLQ